MAINVMARVTPYATPHATPLAVIQVKPGIGDVIWHLPFVRAIAAAAPGGKVIFFAPPTSAAKELLAAEPCVANTIYFRHAGSELQRGVNLIRLVGLLRRHNRSGFSTAPSVRHLRRRLPAFRNASALGSGRRAPSSPIPALVRIIFTITRSIGCAI